MIFSEYLLNLSGYSDSVIFRPGEQYYSLSASQSVTASTLRGGSMLGNGWVAGWLHGYVTDPLKTERVLAITIQY